MSIDGFLLFTDWFFDGIFVDWTVLNRIENAIDQVCKAYTFADHIGNRQDETKEELSENQLTAKQQQLDRLIEKVQL